LTLLVDDRANIASAIDSTTSEGGGVGRGASSVRATRAC
jgi:hypothetical protein